MTAVLTFSSSGSVSNNLGAKYTGTQWRQMFFFLLHSGLFSSSSSQTDIFVGFGSESASRCSDVCTRWLLNTCRPTANPSPAFLVVATCDRLTVVISTSHVWNLIRTEDVHLHTPALQIGTQFLLTLETIVFLFHLLSTTSKPFSSLSTRLAHAVRLGFFTKTCYINSVLFGYSPDIRQCEMRHGYDLVKHQSSFQQLLVKTAGQCNHMHRPVLG